jgi:hypothetical protein
VTDSFDKLKQAAETKINTEKGTLAAWASGHKGWLIFSGVMLVVGFILGKL